MEFLKFILEDSALAIFEKFPGPAVERTFSAGDKIEPEKFAVMIVVSGLISKISEKLKIDVFRQKDALVLSNLEISKSELIAETTPTRVFFLPQNKLIAAALEGQRKSVRDFLFTGRSQPGRLASYLRWQSFQAGEEISMSDSPSKLYWIFSGSCQLENSPVLTRGSLIGVEFFFEISRSFRSPKKYFVISDLVVLACDRLGVKFVLEFWGNKKFGQILTGGPAETAATAPAVAHGGLRGLAEATAAKTRNFQVKVNGLVIILITADLDISRNFSRALIDAPARFIHLKKLDLEICTSVQNSASIRLFIDPRISDLEISDLASNCIAAVGDPDQIFVISGDSEFLSFPGNFKVLNATSTATIQNCLMNS